MEWIEIKICFDAEDKRSASDLLSNIFYDCGLQGVVFEEPGDEPVEGWGEEAGGKMQSNMNIMQSSVILRKMTILKNILKLLKKK